MKVVINKCFGGFGLSAAAVTRYAALKGRPCYLFKTDIRKGLNAPYEALSVEEADAPETWMFSAFDVPNPNEVLRDTREWSELTMDERREQSARYNEHQLETGREVDRADPLLVQVVEELGAKANGKHADLAIVEIPDGVEWEISEYDGAEHVAKTHRVWS